jgi:phosphate-selective porin OprO and OprP
MFARFASLLLAGASAVVFATPALADAATDARIKQLEEQIQALAQQVQDLKRQSTTQYADQQEARAAEPKVSIDNARLTVSSADGKFSASVRGLGQFDAATYSQDSRARNLPAANGPDLSSGTNFRRAYLGVEGKAFGDWRYNVNLNFGGTSGTESSGSIQALWIQYDGLKPVSVRVGAFPPNTGLEDSVSAQDTIFLERSGPSDVIRNLVGGDGRHAVSVMYIGEELFVSASLTGGRVGDTPVFDEQLAAAGRIAYSFKPGADSRIVLSGSVGDLFRAPDATSVPASARPVNIQLGPELTVDGTRMIATGAVNTDNVFYWGAEVGGNAGAFYASAGYFAYDMNRRQTTLNNFSFSGWYAQASFMLTGEARQWNAENATYRAPKVDKPFTLDENGGWGAWEVAARYTNVDLNDDEGSVGLPMPVNGVRGGEQEIWTVGLNWYPNQVIRFALDYQHVDIDRISTAAAVPPLAGLYPQVGQSFDAVSLRSQISF